MNNALLASMPIGVAIVATLVWYVLRAPGTGVTLRRRLEITMLATASLGLVMPLFVVLASGPRGLLDQVEPPIPFSGSNIFLLACVHIALLSALFIEWGLRGSDGAHLRIVWSCLLTSTLLTTALSITDRTHIVLLLLGAALVGSAPALVTSRSQADADGVPDIKQAKSITGALKHVSTATIGTVLLVIGLLLVARYASNLENSGLQQLGLGLLAVGLVIRAGVMPFAPASSDLLDGAPGSAAIILGAITPVVIASSLVVLNPTGGSSLMNDGSLAWLAAVGVFLAGLRALGSVGSRRHQSADIERLRKYETPSDLLASTIALQIGWAMFGVMSGQPGGATGAFVMAANLGIAVPLVLASRGRSKPGLAVGVILLLGFPPAISFAGTLLIGQVAAALGGFWLALLLLGSALTAAAWVSSFRSSLKL